MMSQFKSNRTPQHITNSIYVSEEIHKGDEREHLFSDSKRKELEGLTDKGTWEVVSKASVPSDANILGGRFVLTIKKYQTDNEIYKARFVIQVYRDRLKTSPVHNANTTRHHSPRLLTAPASTLDLEIYSTDVTQAYIQSKDTLDRHVYLIPPEELQIDKRQILKLLRPLYQLAESGDY